MPWRKYKSKAGKHGPNYHIGKGIQVRRNARGNWVLFVEKGGERKNKTIGDGREGLAKAIKAAEHIAGSLNKVFSDNAEEQRKPKIPSFRKYSESWLSENAGRWDEYTYERYETILRLHIWPHEIFKGKKLDEITRVDIKKRLRLLLKTHSSSSVELVHTVICSIFNEAIDDELITANPSNRLLRKLLPPKDKRSVNAPEPLEIEDRDLFLQCAEKDCPWAQQIILKVMVHCGFRLGEVLAMRYKHLDLEKMSYYVCESYKRHRFSLPKKGKKRFVDIPAFLAEELTQYITHLKKESLKNGRGGQIDLMFADPQEHNVWPYSQRKIQMLVKRVCKKAGIGARNPHDLRHTYASILLMSGKNSAYVKEQLGHSSIMMTVDIYGHWIPGKGREGLEEALLGVVQKSHKIAYPKNHTK